MLLQNMMKAASQDDALMVEDVFSTHLWTGNGGTQSIAMGIQPDLFWGKSRSATTDHALYDSVRGATYDLATNSTAAQTTQSTGVTAFTSNGVTIGSLAKLNTSGAAYAGWGFKEAAKFFKNATVTKTAGSNATVDLSSLGTVGMVVVKRTDNTGSWYVWHRSAPIFSATPVIMNNSTGTANMKAVCRSAAGKFVAVGHTYEGYPVYATSLDGINWTTPALMNNSTASAIMTSVCVSPTTGLFVAAGYTNGTMYPLYATSMDGTTWSTPARMAGSSGTYGITSIAVNNLGRFVAVSEQGFSTSVDGITWSSFSQKSATSSFNSVTVSPTGKFVAVGYTNSMGYPSSIYSNDGVTWSGATAIGSAICYLRAICVDLFGRFVAIGRNDSNVSYATTSVDGYTWTTPTLINGYTGIYSSSSIAVNKNGEFVSVGSGTSSLPFYAKSTDGISWTTPIAMNGTNITGIINSIVPDATGNFVGVGSSMTTTHPISVFFPRGIGFLDQTSTFAYNGSVYVLGTMLTLVNGVIADGNYVVYAWAHDDSAGGVIQCGGVTADASGNFNVELGWEPQYVLLKKTSGTSNWFVFDNMRPFVVGGASQALCPNTTGAESGVYLEPRATGFAATSGSMGTGTWAYLAIRRGPMRVPTDGTEVFAPIAYNGNSTGSTKLTLPTGFPVDAAILRPGRSDITAPWVGDRLRGNGSRLITTSAGLEGTNAAFWNFTDTMQFVVGPDTEFNYNTTNLALCFRRAPGFFDTVCYTGTGVARTVAHNLGSAPGMIWVKSRDTNLAKGWCVYHKMLASTQFVTLSDSDPVASSSTYWNDTEPTVSVFTLGSYARPNGNGYTYVAYLFGDTPGLCKAFSYTGNWYQSGRFPWICPSFRHPQAD